jgi:hypothetical protein
MSSRKSAPDAVPVVLSEPAPTPLLYDILQTAKILSTTPFATRQLCRAGQLKHIKIGHKWLISLDAIHKFIRDAERAA